MKSEDPDIERLLKMTMSDRPGQPTPACLDAEELAAWSAGSMAAVEAARAETHLSNCARCQAMLASFARAEPPAAAPEPFWRRLSIGWLVPLTAVAAGLLIWIAIPTRTPPAVPELATARVEQPPPQPRIAPAPPTPAPEPLRAPAATAAAPAAKAPADSRAETFAAAPRAAPVAPQPAIDGADARRRDQQVQSDQVFRGGLAGGNATSAPTPAAVNRAAVVPAIVEFASPLPADSVTVSGASPVVAGRGGAPAGVAPRDAATASGGAGGRGGAAAVAAARASAQDSVQPAQVRWRVLPGGNVERSITDGATWEPISIIPPATIVGGAAASAQVCWLVGRGGVVLRTTDGRTFQRIPFPETTDLSSVRATDARQATVTAADGRAFTTNDAGENWR